MLIQNGKDGLTVKLEQRGKRDHWKNLILKWLSVHEGHRKTELLLCPSTSCPAEAKRVIWIHFHLPIMSFEVMEFGKDVYDLFNNY